MTARRRRHRLGAPSTVRSRLTLLATTLVAVMLAASAVAIIGLQERVLTFAIDETLRQRADNIERDVIHGTFGSQLPNEGDAEDSFLQLLTADGTVVAATANAAQLPPATTPLQPQAAGVIHTVERFPLSDKEFRVLARMVHTTSGPRTLVVGKNLDDVNESVSVLSRSLGVVVPFVTGLLAVLVWWLTGKVLRPVEAMRAEVDRIHGHEDLHRRLPSPRSDDEVAGLARTMNGMLERVEQAMARQRQFVADASHELRTPLTRIRSALEVEMAHPSTDVDAVHRGLLADTVQLQDLVNDLLFLARSESGAVGGERRPVDLDDLVLDEARRLRARGRVQVDVSAVSAARTLGDARKLGRALQNLGANAERHARRCVSFEVRECGEHSRLVVADDGDGIPAEHHATVFERFTRLDAARTRETGGAGLGLAIVRDIVTRHGGTIAVESAVGAGARFVMNLPRAD